VDSHQRFTQGEYLEEERVYQKKTLRDFSTGVVRRNEKSSLTKSKEIKGRGINYFSK
jgi:hypothetical protein